ncbi:hypothetical protein A9Q91_01360 [Candidatus Gracilibacteria bacterium 28_42_T64]|nr:hypothetical protein A9Q91_01360 [Candidatus Gracilibacteria bacterium 28_42_T64]
MLHTNDKKKGIVLLDSKIPVIIYFLIFSLIVYGLSENGFFGEYGETYTHVIHHPTVHFWMMLTGLWVFFLRLGAEIEVNDILKAGPLIIGTILGGVIVPLILTTSLAYFIGGIGLAVALYASAGSMATDVPMAIGSAKMAKNISTTVMISALTMLAVGDDLLGIISMIGLFSQGVEQIQTLSIPGLLVLMVAYFFGKFSPVIVTELKEEEEKDQKTYKIIGRKTYDVTIQSPTFWVTLCIFNTSLLGFNGIEPILGGCLPMIFAPDNVKQLVIEKTESLALWLLLPFALVAGSINVLDPLSWGVFTTIALVGGFGGKLIGIYFGGLICQRYVDPNSDYGKNKLNKMSLLSMAIAGACNGTVAIIFVSVAQTNELIPLEIAAQMKIGFLLTVPLSYLLNKTIDTVENFVPEERKYSGT